MSHATLPEGEEEEGKGPETVGPRRNWVLWLFSLVLVLILVAAYWATTTEEEEEAQFVLQLGWVIAPGLVLLILGGCWVLRRQPPKN